MSKKDKPKILFCISHFLPDKNYGGPITTIKNFCSCFSSIYDIYILTGCKYFDSEQFYDVELDKWIRKYNINVMYNYSAYSKKKQLFKLFNDFDYIYCCEIFWKRSIQTAIYSRKNRGKVIIATMGGLRPNALAIKKLKKFIFLSLVKMLKVYKNVTWSVSSEDEKRDVKRVFGKKANAIIASDSVVFSEPLPSKANSLINNDIIKVVFVSRILDNKNLLFAIRVLGELTSLNFVFDVYGPVEDKQYFEKCLNKAESLSNVKFNYLGYLNNSLVVQTLSNYDIFLFPTKTENFGHVIYESLCAGCIPVISDKTPWNDIQEACAGFVCELDNLEQFAAAIKKIAHYSPEEMSAIKKKCTLYAKNKYEQSIQNSGYRLLFK